MRPKALTAHLPREEEGTRICYFTGLQISRYLKKNNKIIK